MQALIDVALVVGPYVPEGHGAQDDWPTSALYVPAGHEVQDTLPGVKE